jgi:hypothetical protein
VVTVNPRGQVGDAVEPPWDHQRDRDELSRTLVAREGSLAGRAVMTLPEA